jgi:GntR family transcriptional regulator
VTSTALINLFSLNTASGIPIYRQLIDQIKQAIRMNLLQAGEQLPSVRTFASSLQVNPMTISKAFAQLEIEGVLIRKRGIGMLVAQVKKSSAITANIEKPLNEFIENARKENLSDDEISTLLQQYLSIQNNRK